MNFTLFKSAVAAQFEHMQKHSMYRVNVGKDDLWDTYLGSFPDGTNPIYRKRTEHDCSCCKQFIRAVGDVVAIIDGRVVSLWDVRVPGEPAYEAVAKALSRLVKSNRITSPFLHYERTAGTDKNFEQMVDGTATWHHFFVNISHRFVAKDAGAILSEQRATHEVLLRGLKEITMEAIDTVLELIAQNSLYRGAEHKFAVEEFRKLKVSFAELPPEMDNSAFAWTQVAGAPSVSRIRNTSIGTLLIDLSNGVFLEDAVKAFESKVAPANYKRPTSLITKGMIDKAKATLAELGLLSALERRYATLRDITVDNILFADRDARKAITGDVFDTLSVRSSVKNLDRVEELPVERFITEVLPRAETIEVLFENSHIGNLVSLIAPVDPTAGNLFKWPNGFSWSYNGELADSIKERVKKAGGNVTGDLCCRLAWDYTDDLDFHMYEPGGDHIYFGQHRRGESSNGGMLDVDANGADGLKDHPVENIVYAKRAKMRAGEYALRVNNFAGRSTGQGFEVEIEFDGQVHCIAYAKALRVGEYVTVAKIKYTKAGGFEIIESLPSSRAARSEWGLSTQAFHRVTTVLLSPNHWGDHAVGNRHYFFMLDGCVNDGTARGFYNEFLKTSLDPHRKVFEMVASKMKIPASADQLSGLGFSSTQKNTLTCRVKGSFSRIVKIVF
jgi:hypothetical protein